VGDSFNGQIIKPSPFMPHFDVGFSPPLLHCRFEKNKPGTDSFEVEQFICDLQINMQVHYLLDSRLTSIAFIPALLATSL
jgi:hypothetical protein